MFAVDPTMAVAEEAADWGADLLVVHHPLFLKPVHGIARTTPKARTLGVLLDAGCALLTAHTNADQAVGGVSEALATALGLTNLAPVVARDPEPLDKLTTFVPDADAETVRQALGGGRRRHDRRLRHGVVQHPWRRAVPPAGRSHPHDRPGRAASRWSTRCASRSSCRGHGEAPSSPRCCQAHPYEEPAYDVVELAPAAPAGTGSGRIGDVEPTTLSAFAESVAQRAADDRRAASAGPATRSVPCAGSRCAGERATSCSTRCSPPTPTST